MPLAFAPGVPSNTPGIITDCDNFIPYEQGYEGSPSQYDIGATAVAATATGAVNVTKLDGSRRTFVGTTDRIYELSGTSWVDVSQSASAYVSGSVWSFCQFGDATIASNYGNAIQASTSSSFAAIVGAPKAKIVESVVTSGGGFVFAFNTSDTTYGTSPDRWWCSALNDHTDWSVQAATQCTTGRLIGGGGELVAAKRFGSDAIVAYKRDSMFVGRYVGGDTVWAWMEVPEVGCVGPRAVENLGFAHFIVAQDGFWLFDGARPVQIGNSEVRQWFASNVNSNYLSIVQVTYDKDTNRVWIFFPYSTSTTLNRALVYHIGTQRWGLASTDIQTALLFVSAGVTFDTATGTFDAQTLSFDSPLWTASSRNLAVINDSKKLATLSGPAASSSFTSADIGDVSKASRLSEAYVVYQTRPTAASCSAFGSFVLGGTEVVGPTAQAHDEIGSNSTPGRFTLRAHARYHRLRFDFTGPVRITDYTAKITPAGSR